MVLKKIAMSLGIAVCLNCLPGALRPAHAAIIGVLGNAVDLGDATGLDLRNGASEDSRVQGFDEAQDVMVNSATSVDYLITDADVGSSFPGRNSVPVGAPQLGAGIYRSHILHFDPMGSATVTNATFTFDQDIVAIIVNSTFLNNTDSIVGTAANYEPGTARRYDSNDTFTILSRRSLQIDTALAIDPFIDELRVITVPEPSAMFGSAAAGVLGLLMFIKFRQRNQG